MNILYVSHETQLNGAPKSLLEFVTKICDKGIRPIVIVPCKGKLKTELDKRGIDTRVIVFRQCIYKEEYNLFDYWFVNLKAVISIMRLIRKEHIDIVHTNTLAVDVGAIAAYILHIPHVWHFREYLQEDFAYKVICPFLMKWLVKKSRCCIAISEGIKKKYKEKYGVSIVKLYNGIESSAYYSPLDLNISDNKRENMLIAGTILEGKGQWDAIRAVEELIGRGIYVHLCIVGNGSPEYVNRLKKYVRKRDLSKFIEFKPFTNNLQELRIQSDIILVCSRMEAFGRVTAEAMMSGKIVIGSNSGGTLELIGKSEERGYLYTYGNPIELADKVQYILEHEKEVYEKQLLAQNFILKLTDINKYASKLVCIYKKII